MYKCGTTLQHHPSAFSVHEREHWSATRREVTRQRELLE